MNLDTGTIKIESKIKFSNLGEKNQVREKPTFNAADLESIKKYVQEISKSSNPIGKMIDFLPDDIESMNKELQSWIKDSKSYKEQYDEAIKYNRITNLLENLMKLYYLYRMSS